VNSDPLSQIPKRAANIIACFLLVIFTFELVFSIRQQSQTIDESVHIFAGYQYWKQRDFGANPEHPPLVKLVASLPLLELNLKTTEVLTGATKLVHAEKGFPFLYDNCVEAQTILSRARLTCIIFPLILAVLLFVCCFEMFGQTAALLGLVLFVFEPNILANGVLVTTDLAASCFIFASVYSFYRYVRNPKWNRLCLCGLSVALAFSSKHSGLILAPILVLLAGSELPAFRNAASSSLRKETTRLAVALAIISIIAFVGLWAFYSFRFAARPNGFVLSPDVVALSDTIGNKISAGLTSNLWRMKVLPESFLWGLADILVGVVGGRVTFLLGQVYEDGKWFFFPLVFLMKSTLPFLALLAALPLAGRKFAARREIIFMALPPVVFLFTSTLSGMNLGIRHILPIFPFLIVLAALSASRLSSRSRFAFMAILFVILGHTVSSLRAYPNYLTYSNEIVGGPQKTHRAMTDSNVDWGQGLLQASTYLSERRISNCWFAYRIPGVDLAKYHIPCRSLPSGLGYRYSVPSPEPPPVVNGTILVSANETAGQSWGPGELNPYQQFFTQKPDDIIANSILVFHGSFDISLAAAAVHSIQSRRLIRRNDVSESLQQARMSAQLAPYSAEMQAVLCQAMLKSNEPGAEQVCRNALALALRVYPDYQLRWMPGVKAIAQIYSQPSPE
jgi:hypothetical protein